LTDGWQRDVLRIVVAVVLLLSQFFGNVLVKTRVGLFGGAIQVEHLPGANEKDGIGSLGGIRARVETDGGELAEFVIELFAKARQLTEIQGSEIKKKVPVDEFVVDAKEMNLFLVAFGVFVLLLVAFGDTGENVVTGRELGERSVVQSFL